MATATASIQLTPEQRLAADSAIRVVKANGSLYRIGGYAGTAWRGKARPGLAWQGRAGKVKNNLNNIKHFF